MANNFVEEGNVLEWTNGTGAAVAVGRPVVIGTRVGILIAGPAPGASTVANAARGVAQINGVWSVDKTGGDVPVQGTAMYLIVATGVFTTTVGANVLAGFATAAALGGDAKVNVMLNGLPS
jgi:predicted RecA/RadA family phage recombinase